MKHLIMSRPQCLIYSAAMVLNLPVEHIIMLVGRDEGVHIQEIQSVASRYNKLLAPIEMLPVSVFRDGSSRVLCNICGSDYSDRFVSTLQGQKAIILGEVTGTAHATAWDGNIMLDPRGHKYTLDGSSDFAIREAWVVCRMG